MTGMTKEIEDAMDESMKEAMKELGPVRSNLRTVEKKAVGSLKEQFEVLERHDRELRDRVRRERQSIMSEYDRNVVEIETMYAEKISNEVARLENEKHDNLRRLRDEAEGKLRDNELLTKRMR